MPRRRKAFKGLSHRYFRRRNHPRKGFTSHKQKIMLPCKQAYGSIYFSLVVADALSEYNSLLNRSIFSEVPRMPFRVLPRHRTSSTMPYLQGFSGLEKSCTPVYTLDSFYLSTIATHASSLDKFSSSEFGLHAELIFAFLRRSA